MSFKLNPQQQEAVDTIDGALLILAGAGTGKTRVIVQRTGNMLEHGIPASSILAVTFTNKAAKEMQERIAALPDVNPEELPTVCTFHSLCSSILRRHADKIGFTKNFTLATDGYRHGLLREIANELNLANSGIDPTAWLADIGMAKANMLSPQQVYDSNMPNATVIGSVYARYQERLKYMNMMDFDDLLCRTVELWETCPDLLASYQNLYRFLMIDEYQDTNHVQLELVVKLAGERRNVCAVGDDDQSIYGWRGANQENILQFESYFPGAKVIFLEQNYRSTNSILRAANCVISHNSQRRVKNLWSSNGEGEKPVGVRCEDEHKEAQFIATTIRNLACKGSLLDRKYAWRDFAVLYRSTSLARVLEKTLRSMNVPFLTRGSESFYERKEILDLISMMELAANPQNDMAFRRIVNVPPRGIGDATLGRLDKLAVITHQPLLELLSDNDFLKDCSPENKQSIASFAEAFRRCSQGADKPGAIYLRVKRLVDDLHYIEKLPNMYRPRSNAIMCKENIEEFLSSLDEYDQTHHNRGTIANFLQEIMLQENKQGKKDGEENENAVNLMTVHASKGLEFPTVFIMGFEQGLFPHQMALDEGNEAEERRLCYVAMTRARERLFFTYTTHRKIMNAYCCKKLSRFLNEIPDENIDYKTPEQVGSSQSVSKEQGMANMEMLLARFKTKK